MERSLINKLISEAKEFFEHQKFHLPSFAYWTVDDWENIGNSYNEIFENNLGWDITDFGSGDFLNTGLLLFTLRNGNTKDSASKPYAEKIMIVRENQKTPLHYHWEKTEDIINRGGGNLVIELYKSDSSDYLSDESFSVKSDGCVIECEPGERITLTPGESITLEPKIYHSFWGEEGQGTVLVGEVSKVNDDLNDNRFLKEQPRFSPIIEDDQIKSILVNEYKNYI